VRDEIRFLDSFDNYSWQFDNMIQSWLAR